MKRFAPSAPSATFETRIEKQSYGTFSVSVHTADGLILKQHEQPIDSFLKVFWQQKFNDIAGGSAISATTMTGATANYSEGLFAGAQGAYGQYCGIVVGTGSTSATFTDTTLATFIEHGTGAGELEYLKCSVANTETVGIYTMQRTFRNSSGGLITCAEVGVGRHPSSNTAATKAATFLIVRDVLDVTIDVPDGAYLSVAYSFQLANGTINWPMRVLQNCILGDNNGIGSVQAGTAALYQTSGTRRSANSTGTNGFGNLIGLVGEDFVGICLDASSAATTFLTYTFTSRILHGAAAGRLNYYTVAEISRVFDDGAGTAVIEIQRAFTNTSGGNVTINAIGLATANVLGSTGFTSMLDRRVLPSPIVVADGAGFTATWRFCYQF
jgi:hypothetical protein